MVIVSMIVTSVTVGIAFFRKDHSAGDGFRTAWALGALFLILSMGADLTPQIAGPLALLVMLGVILWPDNTLGGVLHLAPTATASAGTGPATTSQEGEPA